MDDGIDVTPRIKSQTTISETADPEAEQSIEVLRAMMQLHQLLLRLEYNPMTGRAKGELCLEKSGVGKIIIKPGNKDDHQIEIFTMAYTMDGENVEDTTRTLVSDADNLEFVGEPHTIPMGLCWPVRIVSEVPKSD